MIQVCFVSDAPFLGGAERYISHVATGLDPSVFSTSLLVRSDADEKIVRWSAGLEESGIPVRRVAMGLPFRPVDAFGIHGAIEELQPDIVHVNMPGPYDGQMGLVAPIARMAGARAVVSTEHLPMVQRLWKRALVKRCAYRYVDRVITVCEANVPYLVQRQSVFQGRIRVVPNALDEGYGTKPSPRAETRRRFGIPVDSVAVVFVGNLLEHKGPCRLVGALCEISEEPWHLVVAGSGPEEEPCRALLESCGLSSRATFAGSLTPDGVEELLSAVDVLSLPSRIEGMPYVILEAMASGLPVIATSVFGIPELVRDGETGLLVRPADARALREALATLIGDSRMRSRFGVAARRRFEERFTIDRQIRAHAAIYGELLAP